MSSTQVILRHGATAEAMSGRGGPKGPPFSRPVCRCACGVCVVCLLYGAVGPTPKEAPARCLYPGLANWQRTRRGVRVRCLWQALAA